MGYEHNKSIYNKVTIIKDDIDRPSFQLADNVSKSIGPNLGGIGDSKWEDIDDTPPGKIDPHS